MIQWSGYEWLPQERWGQIHPDKPYVWYDSTAISIDENQYLHLKTQLNPKYFPDINATAEMGTGLVSCTTKFSYGTFEVEAKLPQGKQLWPAFWMYSWDSWPPEIDVFEGYSNSFGNYFSPDFNFQSGFSIWHITTNAWWKDGDKGHEVKALNHWFGLKDPAKNFIKYKVEWLPNSIKYYYDNKLVRTITDQIVLDQCNNTTMNVIINNNIREPYPKSSVSDFVIKYFKYTPIN